jgi:hypothetical protein
MLNGLSKTEHKGRYSIGRAPGTPDAGTLRIIWRRTLRASLAFEKLKTRRPQVTTGFLLVYPYGSFRLDMSTRLPLDPGRIAPQPAGYQLSLYKDGYFAAGDRNVSIDPHSGAYFETSSRSPGPELPLYSAKENEC